MHTAGGGPGGRCRTGDAYAAAGFVVCGPFAGYRATVNSVCMTLELERSDASPPGRRR